MFSTKELETLFYISENTTDVHGLSAKLELSIPETYRIIRNMKIKCVLENNDTIRVSKCAFARRLYSIMSKGPEVARFFSDSKLIVLLSLLSPKTIQSLSDETKLSESHIRKILRTDVGGGIVRNIDGYYSLNDERHPQIRAFLLSMLDHLEMYDPRIPWNADILFRKQNDVVYSFASQTSDDTLTGFSAMEKYGLDNWNFGCYFYTTEYGELTLDQIFDDALKIAEAEDNWRMRCAAELFYLKNKEQLNPPKEFLDNHNMIMSGGSIKGWPSLKDINDRLWTVGL
jgi:hypothetical protein